MKIATHNGHFHSDEVFAVATLLLIYPESEIVRTRDENEIESADIAVDVGGEYDPLKFKFDHHQTEGAGIRENGIPYASFGLVWKEYGEKISGSLEAAQLVETKVVLGIDALDNGISISTSIFQNVRMYDISDFLYSYWINENVSEQEVYKIFMEAVGLARDLITREVKKAHFLIDEGKLVLDIYKNTKDKRLIILDKKLAWGRVLVEKPEPLIVVYPNANGEDWRANAVRKNLNSFETRVRFPAEWAGKSGKEFADLTGVSDAMFCHRGRFIVTAGSKEGVIALARKILEQEK